MENVFYFKESLEDSFIYKTFNNANDILGKMIKILKYSSVLTKDNIEEQYNQIRRSSISPLSRKVLESFDSGLIEIRYSTDNTVNMPAPIPFVIRKSGDGIIATIFANAFGTIVDGMLNTPTKNIYAIMESAYLALCSHAYPLKLSRNTTLCKICMSVYTQMISKILIKEYALTMDRPLCDKTQFVISKFFLENMWEMPNKDIVTAYAAAPLKYATDNDILEVNLAYEDAAVKDVDGLITFISKMSNRFKGLSTRYFIERYISTYHAPATLSIDYFPYVLFVINNVLAGSFIVSQNALSDIIKNTPGIGHYYSELAKMFG